MSYRRIIKRLKDTQVLASKLGLSRIKLLMEALGNPQDGMKIIHVGGTNGKGSVCAYLTEIIKENNYKVGTYISPYLESPRDAIRLNGEDISREDFAKVGEKVFKVSKKLFKGNFHNSPTEFELLTAMAFVFFEDQAVDFVILEVGLGGENDATNIIKNPVASVFTSISIDHKEILGDSIDKIAQEKSGIIKPTCPVVSNVTDARAKKLIQDKAQSLGSIFYDVTEIKPKKIERDIGGYVFHIDGPLAESLGEKEIKVELSMIGDHQIANGICAISVVSILVEQGIIRINKKDLLRAMQNASQRGRLEILNKNPFIIADGAHNIEGIKALKKVVDEHFPMSKTLFVLGMIEGKEADLMMKELCSIGGKIVTTEPPNKMRLKADELCEIAQSINCPCESLGSVDKAIKYISKYKEDYDLIIVTGSLYLAGRMRGRLN